MAEVVSRILAVISRGPRPLAAGGFLSYVLLSAFALTITIETPTWFADNRIPEIALVILVVKVLIDSGGLWISMTRTLKPKIRQNMCPKCNIAMNPSGFNCPTCGGTFTEKK